MKVTSKITENWWMIFKCFPPEPSRFWRLYIFAIFLTLGLILIAGLCAYFKHGWDAEPKIICKTPECIKCIRQKESWNNFRIEAKINQEAAIKKMQLLIKIKSNPDDNNFDVSWNWLETEINQLKKIIDKQKKISIASVKDTGVKLLRNVLLSLLLFVLLNRLVLFHAKSVQEYFIVDKSKQIFNKNWILPLILISTLIAFFMILAEVCTSVLAEQKTSFGWGSFYVTPSAFIFICIAFISYGIVAATPFTILWCLSNESYVPIPNIYARDGKFGAERYVEFIQTWTLWLIIGPSILGIFWLRDIGKTEINFAYEHLLHGVGPALIIVIIIIKLIRNAIILRYRCNQVLLNIESGEIVRPQTDPTIAFLGTEWWKLPATIGVSLASIWALLEVIGISKFIISIIR